MRHIILLLAALALLRPSATAAQGSPSRCGDTTLAQDDLEDLAHYFTDDSDADFRAGLIAQVPENAPKEVVRDSHVCNSLHHKMIAELRTHTNWRELQRSGFTHRMLRFGAYYAVLVDPVDPPGSKVFGWTEMMVFRVSDMALLGIRLV